MATTGSKKKDSIKLKDLLSQNGQSVRWLRNQIIKRGLFVSEDAVYRWANGDSDCKKPGYIDVISEIMKLPIEDVKSALSIKARCKKVNSNNK